MKIQAQIFISFLVGIIFSIPAMGQILEPCRGNPWYWCRGGEPVLLIGGSYDDNLFQWPPEELVAQLDKLQEA